jgi:hypothetical protein
MACSVSLKADYDFLEWTQDFQQQGIMTCLCPGTASWNRSVSPEEQQCLMLRIKATIFD